MTSCGLYVPSSLRLRECIDCTLEGGACFAFMAVPRAEEMLNCASGRCACEDACLLSVEDGAKWFAVLLKLREEEFDVFSG